MSSCELHVRCVGSLFDKRLCLVVLVAFHSVKPPCPLSFPTTFFIAARAITYILKSADLDQILFCCSPLCTQPLTLIMNNRITCDGQMVNELTVQKLRYYYLTQ